MSEEVITDVATAIAEGHNEPLLLEAAPSARQLDMNYFRIWTVLQRVACLYSYKISHLHELKPSDYDKSDIRSIVS